MKKGNTEEDRKTSREKGGNHCKGRRKKKSRPNNQAVVFSRRGQFPSRRNIIPQTSWLDLQQREQQEKLKTEMSRAEPTPVFVPMVNTKKIIEERTTFESTIYANSSSNETPVSQYDKLEKNEGISPSHIHHPPSVIWMYSKTCDYSLLGRSPEYANFPASTNPLTAAFNRSSKDDVADILMETGNKPIWVRKNKKKKSNTVNVAHERKRKPVDGPWYILPDLNKVLARCKRGDYFGDPHVTPPPPDHNYASHSKRVTPSTKSIPCSVLKKDRGDSLTSGQQGWLKSLTTAYYQFPHRVRRILREMRNGQIRIDQFPQDMPQDNDARITVGMFLYMVDKRTDCRLVHISLDESNHGEININLCYAMDKGGRYFTCVRWEHLLRPTRVHRLHSTNEDTGKPTCFDITWWGLAVIKDELMPRIYLYSCPCTPDTRVV
jgi:hypothetical protein